MIKANEIRYWEKYRKYLSKCVKRVDRHIQKLKRKRYS